MYQSTCPNRQSLQLLLDQGLPTEQTDMVSTHVDHCESCQSVLEELSHGSHLKGLGLPSPSAPQPSDGFLKRLKSNGLSILGPLDKSSPSYRPTIPGYAIMEELGRGGVGVVFKANQIAIDRIVAVKVLISCERASGPELERFRYEARAAGALNHPNVVRVFEVGECNWGPYVVLEYVSGGTLSRFIRHRPQPAKQAVAMVRQLTDAIAAAHEHGIIHRDIKPSNVLLGDVPKLTDFGLAKLLNLDSSQTQSGMILGTPSYMAPEQARGSKSIDARTDVYGIGALLYDMLTGRPPFQAAQPIDTIFEVVNHPPIPPRMLDQSIPRDLEAVCLKCLEKEPSKRYASARDLRDDLDRFLNGLPTIARPVGFSGRTWKLARRHPLTSVLVLALIVGATVSLIALSVLYSISERDRSIAESQREIAIAEGVRSEDARKGTTALNQFLLDQFLAAPSLRENGKGRDVTVLQMVESAAEKIDSQFAGQPEIAASLHDSVGETFQQFGEYEKSIEHHRSALTLRRHVLGAEAEATLSSELALAHLHSLRNQLDESSELLAHAVPSLTTKLGPDNKTRLSALHELAVIERKRQNYQIAKTYYQEVLDRSSASLGDSDPLTSQAILGLAEIEGNLSGPAAAVPMLERAVSVVEKAHGENSIAHLVVRGRLGEALLASEKFERAESVLSDVLEMRRKVIGPNHPTNFSILGWLADCWQARGKYEEAELAYRDAIAGYEAAKLSDSPLIARTQTRLGNCLVRLGRFSQAEEVLLDAETRFAGLQSVRSEWPESNRRAISELYLAWKRPAIIIPEKTERE
jgi:eukaryotic-like serine/threonine-protein kinase